MYSDFENDIFDINNKSHIDLISYRSLVLEYFFNKKNIVYKTDFEKHTAYLMTPDKIDLDNISEDCFLFVNNTSLEISKENIFKFSVKRYKVYEFSEKTPILCSTALIFGKDQVIMNIIHENNKSYCIVSTMVEDNKNYDILINEIDKNNNISFIIQLAFAYSENSFFNIEWYNNLSVLKKNRLKMIYMSNCKDIIDFENFRRNMNFC